MGHKKKNRVNPQSLNMPMGGVDTHAHLISAKIWDDCDNILERATECGLSQIGEVFLRHQQYINKKDYFTDKKHIFFIYGLHPIELLSIEPDELDLIKADIKLDLENEKRIKAVGEIGLDYYWKDVPQNVQEYYFRLQLNMAKEFDLPVVIHSRDAFDDTIRILLSEGFSQKKLLWHCFDKDSEKAQIILDNGWNISIPGSVTYKGNEATKAALHLIPKDRLMLETDCPYLTPEPWRGTVNEPAYTVFTAECIAKELNIDMHELWVTCGNNARKFFNLNIN